MRRFVLVACGLFMLSTAALPLSARADDDSGTETYACPPGSVLTGFGGYQGVWIETLAAVCSPWRTTLNNGKGGMGAPDPHWILGWGQAPKNKTLSWAQCGYAEAVTSWRYGLATPGSSTHVQDLEVQCTNVITHIVDPEWHALVRFETGRPTHTVSCEDANTVAKAAVYTWEKDDQNNFINLTGMSANCEVASKFMAEAAAASPSGGAPLPPFAEVGWDRVGGDLRNVPAAGPLLCQQACAGTNACVAWTYRKSDSRCFMKASVATGHADNCCVSGVMLPKGAAVNTDRPGNTIAQIDLPDSNPSLCRQACVDNAQCTAWTYVAPDGFSGPLCYLKAPTPVAKANTCCVSGTVIKVISHPADISKLGTASSNALGAGSGAGAATSSGSASVSGNAGSVLSKLQHGKLGNAGPPSGGVPPVTRTLSATCTSMGETCNVPAAMNLPAGTWSMRVAAPASHCSPIDYRVTTDNHGELIGDSGALGPGASSGAMPVPATAHQIYVTATGILGGCNTGRLGSWSVVVTLTAR